VSISQPDYTWALAKLIQSEPIDVWKTYLRVRLLDANARILPAGFRDASYQFHDVAITGVKQDMARWQRGVANLNGAMGEAIGQVYVSKYFPPAYKARMVQLVDNLLKTYSTSIDDLAWMSAATKLEAHAKLARYGVKIGYPDVWRDYTGLDVKAGDPVGNRTRAAMFEYHRQAVRNGKAVDRTEWGMTPQTVNAYYDPTKNEVVFPAAILQPPFFDMKADDAVNYGAIGAVIGHEISHGFDDQGSQYDGDGKLRDWWTPADRKAFEGITSRLDAQFSAYEPLPGVHLNGKLTMGENIADLSGLQIAYKAWKLSLGGKPSPVIGGFTGEQRFYYGFSQVWRSKVRDERTLQLVVIDPHSPAQFRADGAAINSDGFHDAFGTKPGDKMWKAPADRLRLW
jgi:putative endopeptidase